MIKAAIFNSAGDPIKIMEGRARQLNANQPTGGTWREIPEDVDFLNDVPPLEDLPAHPDLEDSE